MQARTHSDFAINDLELWTLDDAEAWKEAELGSSPDVWVDEDPLLDNDLWMEGAGEQTLSVGRHNVYLA